MDKQKPHTNPNLKNRSVRTFYTDYLNYDEHIHNVAFNSLLLFHVTFYVVRRNIALPPQKAE